jgi:hypothetical protein
LTVPQNQELGSGDADQSEEGSEGSDDEGSELNYCMPCGSI